MSYFSKDFTILAAAKEQAPPPPYPFGKPADKGEVATAEVPKTGFSFGQSAAGVCWLDSERVSCLTVSIGRFTLGYELVF